MDEASARDQAQRYFDEAYAAQMKGDLERATAGYRKSIECQPTAEAHTFLGWTYSFQRKYRTSVSVSMKRWTRYFEYRGGPFT